MKIKINFTIDKSKIDLEIKFSTKELLEIKEFFPDFYNKIKNIGESNIEG